jgi:thiol-disulfide isomerase/thioredoxin
MNQPNSVPPAENSSQAGGYIVPSIVGALVVAAVLFVLVTIFTFAVFPSKVTGPQGPVYLGHPAVGQEFTGLSLTPLLGADKLVAPKDLSGKVALLNFWGTWCGFCCAELPDIAALKQEFGDRPDFELVLVSCGPPDDPAADDMEQLRAKTEAHLARAKIAMPMYADPGEVSRAAFDRMGPFRGYPGKILLDRQGVVRAVWFGRDPHKLKDLRAEIQTLLAEPVKTPGA